MENTTSTSQQLYHDSPTSSRSSSPTPHTSTPSTSSTSTVKPLPALPASQQAHSRLEPYRDDPSAPPAYRDEPSTPTNDDSSTQRSSADNTPLLTPTASDDNIPLAYLLSTPYPHEAPPSYSVAVRQTHSYRDTLIDYIPNNNPQPPHRSNSRSSLAQHSSRRPLVIEFDPESGEVVSRTDDVRHGVEKVVAMFIVAGLLLCLSAVLGWLAFGF